MMLALQHTLQHVQEKWQALGEGTGCPPWLNQSQNPARSHRQQTLPSHAGSDNVLHSALSTATSPLMGSDQAGWQSAEMPPFAVCSSALINIKSFAAHYHKQTLQKSVTAYHKLCNSVNTMEMLLP